MLNQSGITKVSATTQKTILIAPELAFSMSCMVANTGVSAGEDGKKIVKAGTPLSGSLLERETAFTVSGDTFVGVLLHDVDVTGGTANAQVVASGFVDVTKVDADVAANLISAASKLSHIVLVK